MKNVLAFFVFTVAALAALHTVQRAAAASFADGTATWSPTVGMTVTFAPQVALASGDTITLTFPAQAPVSSGFLFYAPGDDPVRIAGHSFVNFTRNATDNSVAITLYQDVSANQELTITLDPRVITQYDASAFAQQSIAITMQRASGAPLGYGIAMLTNNNTTQVTATVPLFVTLAVNDTTMDLGTLSVASVKSATQTYTVNSNNRTGVKVMIAADGALRTPDGETIAAVSDGAVTAGHEEYGVALANLATHITPQTPFDSGDRALPTTPQALVTTAQPVANATFDLVYKAAIDGATVAGIYKQVVTVTVATNS